MARVLRCDECGNLEHVLLDGYAVGDRLLEGVMFEIRLVDGKYVAATQAKDASYMRKLNEKKWLKEMAEYAADTDIATCPKCSNDVDMPNEEESTKPAVVLPLTRAPDILKRKKV